MKIRKYLQVIRSLYVENDFPSDRLICEHAALVAFAKEFNSRVEENFSPEVIAAELERIRKNKAGTGGLPRVGRSYQGPHFMFSDN
jgi:hypothetical protein